MADPRFREQARRFLAWRARQRSAAAGRESLEGAHERNNRLGLGAVRAGVAAVDVMFEANARGYGFETDWLSHRMPRGQRR